MKKKVLFIIWSFTAGGGAEKILANVVNNLDADKYDISILEYVNFDIRTELVNNNIKVLKPILKVNKFKGIKYIAYKIYSKIIYLLSEYYPSFIRKIFVREHYDVEVAFNYLIPSFLIGMNKSTRTICWVHSSIEDLDYQNNSKSLGMRYNKRQLKSFNNIENIVAISKKTEQSIKNVYPSVSDKVSRIYNGYEFEKIVQLSKDESDFKKSKKTLISIGRLVEQKNYELLIEVANILNEKSFDFELIIIGEGEQLTFLENMIRKHNLDKQVKMLGYQNNPYKYLKQADLFCLTSITEGFPTVLIESMFLGCPFISTPVAGADELSENGENGIVCSYDAEEISEEIIRLFSNENRLKNMSEKCFEKSIEYSIERQIVEIEKIMELNYYN